MRKKTIAFFFIVSWLLAIASIVMLFGAVLGAANIMMAPHPSVTINGSSINASLTATRIVSQVNFSLFYVGLVLLISAALFYTISWIGALVATAKQSKWLWFFCIFFFHWFAEMIYLFAGPAAKATAAQKVPWVN